jgi:hypothetical protein
MPNVFFTFFLEELLKQLPYFSGILQSLQSTFQQAVLAVCWDDVTSKWNVVNDLQS